MVSCDHRDTKRGSPVSKFLSHEEKLEQQLKKKKCRPIGTKNVEDACLSCYIVGTLSRLLFLWRLCCRVVVVFGCGLDQEQEVQVAVSVVPEEKSIPMSTGSPTPTCKHLRPCCNTSPSPPTSLPVFRAAAWTRPIKAWRRCWWPSASRTCRRFCSDPCRRTRKLPSFSNRCARGHHLGALCPTVELFFFFGRPNVLLFFYSTVLGKWRRSKGLVPMSRARCLTNKQRGQQTHPFCQNYSCWHQKKHKNTQMFLFI